MTSNWLERKNIDPMWAVLNKEVDLGEPTSFLDHVHWGCTQRECQISKDVVDIYKNMFESRISAGTMEKYQKQKPQENLTPKLSLHGPNTWKVHAKKCVERYCELAHKTTRQLHKVATPCMDDHQFEEEENESVGELSTVRSQIVLKYLYLARIGRPDILWSVNKRLARLISYIHHTCEYRQYCYV